MESFNMRQIEHGNFTMSDINKLVFDCKEKSKKLGFWITWKPVGYHVQGFIVTNFKQVVWRTGSSTTNFIYNYCMTLENLNQRLDFMLKEKHAAEARAAKENTERENERRIAAMPGWSERIKKQGS